MVYVFGLDVPLLEIIFVFFILLILGLIFILVELRKLRKLLSEETRDIARFEEDIAKLEEGEGKTSSKSVKAYIQNALNRGISEEQIESTLLSRGWDKSEIDRIFKSTGKSS